MHSRIEVHIDAPAELVFGLARDVRGWSSLLPHYVRSRQIEERSSEHGTERVLEFIARRPLLPVLGLGLPVTWRSRTWPEPADRRLRFIHTAGVTRGMDVTWRIEPTGPASCRVVIDHDFAPRLPFVAGFVDRWFTESIAGRTLATFKTLAEAVHEANQSATPATPNLSR
ncbi:MAG: SRPBCC family protein [Candidatus Limnocylindrales bacterium]